MTLFVSCVLWYLIIVITGFSIEPDILMDGDVASITCSDPIAVKISKSKNNIITCVSSADCVVVKCFIEDESCTLYFPHFYNYTKSGENVTIVIANVSRERDNGNWTCIGSDVVYEYITVDVKAAPDAPSNITYSQVGSRSICVDWRAGFHGGDQQKFIVQHSTDDKRWTESTPISSTSYCIENLQPGTLYYIRVVARNRYGDSQPVYLRSLEGEVLQTSSETIVATSSSPTPSPTPSNNIIIYSVAASVGSTVAIASLATTIYCCRKRRHGQDNVDAAENRRPVDGANDKMSVGGAKYRSSMGGVKGSIVGARDKRSTGGAKAKGSMGVARDKRSMGGDTYYLPMDGTTNNKRPLGRVMVKDFKGGTRNTEVMGVATIETLESGYVNSEGVAKDESTLCDCGYVDLQGGAKVESTVSDSGYVDLQGGVTIDAGYVNSKGGAKADMIDNQRGRESNEALYVNSAEKPSIKKDSDSYMSMTGKKSSKPSAPKSSTEPTSSSTSSNLQSSSTNPDSTEENIYEEIEEVQTMIYVL